MSDIALSGQLKEGEETHTDSVGKEAGPQQMSNSTEPTIQA